LFELIFLGALQGLTEFLPISSTAHLRIAGEFFPGAQDPGARFTAITQIGTEIAVLIFFRKDIKRIISAWFLKNISRQTVDQSQAADSRLGWLIIIGSLPIIFLGLIGQNYIEDNFRSLWLIAIVLIVFSVVLGLTDHYGKTEKKISDLSVKHGLLYGFAQAIALIPGVSRSGATIAMGRYLGYGREAALRYSFLLAMPAVFGSGIFQLYKALKDSGQPSVFSLPETFIATGIAFIVGYLVIAWLLKFVTTRSFLPFIIYRIALGATLIALLTTGVIN
jgi:undecaprenyl-diphosphatase